MDGGFACPECGCEIRLKGLSPGRQVRCGWCQTAVEVPFIPRADQIKTMRRSRAFARRWQLPLWAKVAMGVLAVAIALAGVRRAATYHRQKAENEEVDRLVESSREAESSGRLGEALAALEGALAQAGALNPSPSGLAELRDHRDRLARREAEAQLAGLDGNPSREEPGRLLGRALTLLARVQKDGALDGLEPKLRTTIEALRLRWVEADAADADAADADGQPGKALEFCQRLHRNADDLPAASRQPWQDRATDLARRIISRQGTIIEPVRGQFTIGSSTAYQTSFLPTLTGSLRRMGYLPRPPGALWDDLWRNLAPYHIDVEVQERQDETYLESQNRLSALTATITLSRKGETIWRETPYAKTHVPLPGLPAYQASRNSVGARRNPEFERLLYDDARENLLHQLGLHLRRLPACPSASPENPPEPNPAPAV